MLCVFLQFTGVTLLYLFTRSFSLGINIIRSSTRFLHALSSDRCKGVTSYVSSYYPTSKDLLIRPNILLLNRLILLPILLPLLLGSLPTCRTLSKTRKCTSYFVIYHGSSGNFLQVLVVRFVYGHGHLIGLRGVRCRERSLIIIKYPISFSTFTRSRRELVLVGRLRS